MDHRLPPVWCHLIWLDFRLSLIFDHLINIISIVNESDPRSNVHYLGSSENKAWKKNSGLSGIWTHDLCDTDAVLYQLS